MDRKEEIQKAAEEARAASAETLTTHGTHSHLDDIPFIKLSYDEIAESAFIKGAEWADIHPNSQWIDINKQFPEDDQLVLARVDNGKITLARAWIIDTENLLSVKWTAEYIPLFGEYYITHWMPIPEFKTK